MPSLTRILRDLLAVYKTLIVLITPLILIVVPTTWNTTEGKCAYGLLLMAIYWVTEALPLAATALLPVLIFPLLGVMKASELSSNYIKESSMFGLGGLMIAIAVEKWNLHKRIALRALLMVGSEPKWLMFGFMLPTWFLSMWVSNTATTAMMIPIVGAVLEEFKLVKKASNADDIKMNEITNGGVKTTEIPVNVYGKSKEDEFNKVNINSYDGENEAAQFYGKKDDKKGDQNTENIPDDNDEGYSRMCKGMSLCVAYAANIGGTGSLSGTGPNLIMQGQADQIFRDYGMQDSGVNFASWMVFALPGSVICVLLAWLWLSFYFLGWRGVVCRRRRDKYNRVQETIRKSYDELGPLSFAEIVILIHFIVLVVLWFFRQPPYIDGWGSLFKTGFVGDSAAALLIVTSLFTFPSERPAILCFRRKNPFPGDNRPRKSVPAILDWPTVEKKFPWGVLLLIGGGYALADACEKSGLSAFIGEQLEVLGSMPPWAMNIVLTLIIAMLTEVTSNSATTTLILPILANLALRLGLNPLYLMFPCVIAASFAFMLPVATPPNAIVFATGHLTVKDMAMAGFLLNFICIGVLALGTNLWGEAYFKFTELPSGFNRTDLNTTRSVING
ncbi:Na(+)/citrate cotransporter-like isoform X2 [Ostrea edulis]|uniref:Na(+)/citrate cotransporter-like isoform X2 n=1 Tax=Ostrea edulis TaxID=37623 RepID=UPI0024AEA33F|nr:Na(+)/citrate cotransporter-like isoform X2 [Ostrea edulis]